VFCKQDAVIVVSPDLTVTVDGGTPDAGTAD
jgi:hypothetical protein